MKLTDPRFPCGVCSLRCFKDCIECSGCKSWYHFQCVPMTSNIFNIWSSDFSLTYYCKHCAFVKNEFNIPAALNRTERNQLESEGGEILCEDTFDKSNKFELLVALEQHGYCLQDADGADQVISSLLNIFQDGYKENDFSFFSSQLLVTATSLLIQSDLFHSDVHIQLNNTLFNVISKASRLDDRQLRGIGCQCLIQLEEYAPGELGKKKDLIIQLAREEKTEVCQDYLQLVTLLLKNSYHDGYLSDNGSPNGDGKPEVLRTLSVVDAQETKQLVCYIVDSTPYFTVPGLWRVMTYLTEIVKTQPEISSLIFKPLILHHMSTMDPSLFHLVLYLQRTSSEQILTEAEENVLMSRMVTLVNHPILSPAQRLMTLQWIEYYKIMPEAQKWSFYPTIFDGIDCQSAKLRLLSKCFSNEETSADLVAVILQKSSTYLQVLVKQTGRSKAVIALFKILYVFYKRHGSPQMAQYVKNLVLDIATELPQYIPHVLDFITALLQEKKASDFYIEILKSLHNQVVGSAIDQILLYYEYYLMVLNKSTKEEDINPKFAIKFLGTLANCCPDMHCCDWKLGQSILTLCRNILCYQSTDKIYTELGYLLHRIMLTYEDVDICDKAKLYYALLTGASDVKIREILKSSEGDDVNQALTTFLPGTETHKDKTEIIYLDHRIFNWKTTKIMVKIEDFEVDDKESDKQQSLLESYLLNLKRIRTSLCVKLNISLGSDSNHDSIYAFALSLKGNKNYTTYSDCHIASLEKNETKDIEIKIKLLNPEPLSLTAWSTFASATNSTFSCQLGDIDVHFADMLHPLLWSIIGSHSKEEITNFFRCLWNELTNDNKKLDGIESVKLMKIQVLEFHQKARNLLKPYLVETGTDEYWYGIFLSPSYHLLLKIRPVAQNTVISVATDYATCLPYVDSLLESVIR